MKKLVLVHGRSQEGKDPGELKWTWVNSLKEGLAKSDLTLPIAYDDIAFPYYGDILDDLIYGSEAAGAGAEVIAHGPEDDEELRFKQQLAEVDKAGISKDQILEASGDPTLEHGPANWEWVQSIARAFDRFVPGVPGAMINLFTHDVYLYCRRPGVRDAVDATLRDLLDGTQETMVVGHSLGTIVTYSVLARDEARLKVPLFVTLGSPLAVQLVQNQFHPIRTPKCVSACYNAMDERDVVALYPLLRPRFVVNPEIENNTEVDNFTRNRHGIVGYLSDKDVAKKIHDALVA
jgi:hypothetical protein